MWKASQESLKSQRRTGIIITCLFTVFQWVMTAYLLGVFHKHEIWNPLAAAHPIRVGVLIAAGVFSLALPLLTFLLIRLALNRTRMTHVSLLENRVVKRVKDAEESITLSELSEMRALRSHKGTLTKMWLLTKKGSSLTLECLDHFDDLFLALKTAAPSCPVKEWTITKNVRRIWLLYFVLFIPLIALLLHGSISINFFSGFGFVLIFCLWFTMRSYAPVCYPDAPLLSSQLGVRYRWLDFAFAGLAFYLLVNAVAQGIEVVRKGEFVHLLGIFFTPTILTWLFVVPLLPKARLRKADRLILASLLTIAIGIQLTEGRQVHTSKRLALNLAYNYSTSGRYHKAIDILEDFIQNTDEQSDYAWELLAYTCKQTGDWKRLLNIAEDTINVNSHYAPAYHMAGLAASQLYGLRSKESRKYYTKYLELNPNPEETAFVKEIFPDL